MKQTRKNPFAQATTFTGPPQPPPSNYGEEIAEDPTFQEISHKKGPFAGQGSAFPARAQNPFGSTPNYHQEEDYSDFNPPNKQANFNTQQPFGNSGWSTGERRAQPFTQPTNSSPNEFQDGYSKPGFSVIGGEGNEYNYSGYVNEPPILEGKFLILRILLEIEFG